MHLAPIFTRLADAVYALTSHPDVLVTMNIQNSYPDDETITWIEAAQA